MRFEYLTLPVKDLVAKTEERKARTVVTGIEVAGQPTRPSGRFWSSLFSRFGFNGSVFKFFDYHEVFNRISERSPNDSLRCCIEHHGGDGPPTLLGTNNPKRAVIEHDDLVTVLRQHGGEDCPISYSGGIVRSTHTPRFGMEGFEVGGDAFKNMFVLDCPIDGYGKPSLYLMALRQICQNGAIGLAPAFRSLLNLGRGEGEWDQPIIRAIEGFNAEDGFVALKQRFDAATKSWASIHESQKLYKALVRLHARGQVMVDRRYLTDAVGSDGESLMEGSPVLASFHRLTKDLGRAYGLANLDALSAKRQRTLPAPCKVYDLLNLASEVATHHTTEDGGRTLQGFIGELVGSGEEYDLELSCEKFSDWSDFLVLDEQACATKASLT